MALDANTVLFDLGNTLARYYTRQEFPRILKQAVNSVVGYLRKENLLKIPWNQLCDRVEQENHERPDHQVRPLEERLLRIFGLEDKAHVDNLVNAMCRCFTRPILSMGQRYEDTIPVLDNLKKHGIRTAVVSNTAWGSPAYLWREELQRLGLTQYLTETVFCRDVGWRKPAPQIFEFTMNKLRIKSQNCVFVGDDPRWDLAGPRALGIKAIHIDRHHAWPDVGEPSIRNLHEMLGRLGLEDS